MTVQGPGRPLDPGVHPPPRAHPVHALAHPGPLGLLGADAGRAGDPPGARLVQGGRGTALADLTLPGIGRNPAWLLRISELSRLPIVMGGGWYRTAYYPPEALIEQAFGGLAGGGAGPRRDGRGGGDGHPDRDPGRDRDRQAVGHAGGGAGLPRRGALLAPDRPGDLHARGALGRGRGAADDPRGGGGGSRTGGHRPRGQLPGAGPLPVADQPRGVGRVRLPGHVLHADGEARRGGGSSTCSWSCSTGGTPIASCSATTSATTASCATSRETGTPTCPPRSCRGSGSGVSPRPRSSS